MQRYTIFSLRSITFERVQLCRGATALWYDGATVQWYKGIMVNEFVILFINYLITEYF
jgi:hypothetical protein